MIWSLLEINGEHEVTKMQANARPDSISFFDRFPLVMITAINHGGDSCAAASMAGCMMGAAMGLEGMEKVKPDWIRDLTSYPQMLHVADEFWHGQTFFGDKVIGFHEDCPYR